MKIQVISIKDRLADVFGQPMYTATTGMGVRMFQDALADSQSGMYKHPDDYDLYKLGEYDDNVGKFTNCPQGPVVLALGKEHKPADKN